MNPGAGERALVSLTALAHGLVHADILLIPVLVVPWAQEFHLSPLGTGLLAAAAYVGFGATSLPSGFWADRVPAKFLIFTALVGSGGPLLVASTFPRLEVLAPCLALEGVSLGLYHPCGLALLSRQARTVGRALGYHGMGGSLGITLGPFSAVSLLLFVPWPGVVAIFGLASVLSGLAVLRGVPESPSRQRGRPADGVKDLLRPHFLLVLCVFSTAGTAYCGAITFLPSFLRSLGGLPTLTMGGRPMGGGDYLFPLLLGIGAVGQLLSGHLAESSRPALVLALLSMAAGAVIAGLGLFVAVSIPFALAFGFLLFSLEPLQNILVVRTTSPDARGFSYGFAYVSLFGVGAVGAPLTGGLLASGGYGLAFGVLGLFLVASAVASCLLGILPERGPQDRGQEARVIIEGGGAGGSRGIVEQGSSGKRGKG